MKKIFYILLISTSISACGQQQNNTQNNNNTKDTINKKDTIMDLSKISNQNVKKAIEALQASDKNAWYSYFTENATFTDDGRTMDFKSFFDNAFAKKEKFIEIDTVENEGKDLYGKFYAGQWGTFRVYFKFHQNSDGKFTRLDIGQAPK